MNIKTALYDIICEKTGINTSLSAAVDEGIEAYVKEEKLDAFIDKFPEEMKLAALRMYMKPITDNGAEFVTEYFAGYTSHLMFDKISKEAFDLAMAKKNRKEIDTEAVDKLEREFNEVYTNLSTSYRLGAGFSIKASETLLDIKFAKGESRQMSFRLMHTGV